MANLLELSAEYRVSGISCRKKLKELRQEIDSDGLSSSKIVELRRNITLLTAMSRECIATSNYLRDYFERRDQLARRRKETGI